MRTALWALPLTPPAIAADPTFADPYCNLTPCFEKLGAASDACGCWGQYLKLDSTTEWAGVARMHLCG